MKPTIIMPKIKSKRPIQEKIVIILYIISFSIIFSLRWLPYGEYLVAASMIGLLIAVLITTKYSLIDRYYDKLSELGYVRLKKRAGSTRLGSIGVFKKENTEYTLYLCRDGVVYLNDEVRLIE